MVANEYIRQRYVRNIVAIIGVPLTIPWNLINGDIELMRLLKKISYPRTGIFVRITNFDNQQALDGAKIKFPHANCDIAYSDCTISTTAEVIQQLNAGLPSSTQVTRHDDIVNVARNILLHHGCTLMIYDRYLFESNDPDHPGFLAKFLQMLELLPVDNPWKVDVCFTIPPEKLKGPGIDVAETIMKYKNKATEIMRSHIAKYFSGGVKPKNCEIDLYFDGTRCVHSRMIICSGIGVGLSNSFDLKHLTEMYLMPMDLISRYWNLKETRFARLP